MNLHKLTLLLFLISSTAHAQNKENPKLVYDSIMALDVGDRGSLIRDFFDAYSDHHNQSQLALCHHEYARTTYRSDLDNAIRHVNQAIVIRTRLRDTAEVSKSLYALGHFYYQDGNYRRAIDAYTELTGYGRANSITAKAYNRLGVVYTNMGDYENAKTNYLLANNYFTRHQESEQLLKNHLRIAGMYGNISWSANRKAIMHHALLADSLASIIDLKLLEDIRLNQIWGNLNDTYGTYDKAIGFHQKALELSLPTEDSAGISRSYNNLGISCWESGQLEQAIAHYNKSIAFAVDVPQTKAIAHNNLGDYYVSIDDYQEGMQQYQHAITQTLERKDTLLYTTLPDIEELKVSPHKTDLLGYLIDKANAWITYYTYDPQEDYLTQALNTFKLADQLVDVIRFESTQFQSKLFWRSQSADLYMKAVKVCHQLDDPVTAFYFMEKNKAILLLEDVTQESAKENARLPERLSLREYDLRRLIHLAEEDLNDRRFDEPRVVDSLRDAVYDRKNQYRSFIDSLETGYPDYYAYKRDLALISFEEAKEPLGHEADHIVYYILNELDGYGLLLSKGRHSFFQIKDVPLLQANIDRLRVKLEQPFFTPADVASYQETATALYATLFPFPRVAISGERLTIIPDHNLQQIPFEALMNSGTDTESYLIKEYDINYQYSLSFARVNEMRRRNPTKALIGFAPVTFSGGALPSLSKSTEELSKITALFSGDVYDQNKASKESFVNQINDYNIIHLSTHAGIGEDTSPWIAFHDDKLSLDELYASQNQADMVVLSACNTSSGELKSGEGVMSIARGFFSTGTNSVISTLWSANEKSTEEVITSFYAHLREGHSKTKALQDAKRAYLSSHTGTAASPYYWAAPILIGSTKPIDTDSQLPWYLMLGVPILLVSFLLLRRMTQKS